MNFRRILESRNKGTQTSPDASATGILDNLPHLFRDVCGLKLDGKPAKTGLKRKPAAWADLRPESAWMLGWNFLRRKPKKGKYGKMLLEPRGCAKSTKVRALCTGLIIEDRDFTIHYLSQNVEMAANRVTWVRQRLKANESRFGTFETRDRWGNEAFTVAKRSSAIDEPTMLAGGPDKDVTGSHPAKFVWDDPVVPKNNRSRLARSRLIRTFEATLDQRSEGSDVTIIGTIYPYHNLYREIKDYYGDDFEILRIGAWGAAYDENDNIVWGDPDSEELNYPWFTMEYLNQQRKTPAKQKSFRGQYLNLWQFESDDAPFTGDMLIEGNPPLTKDGKLHSRLAVYMLTDLGQTDRPTKHTSETVLAVIAKDIDGILYIVDLDIGRWNSDQVQERFLSMYHRWENQGLRYATMETRGPGRDAIHHIPKLAMARKEKVPFIIPVPRSSREDKDARIGQLYVPFRHHKIKFSIDLIQKPHIFTVDRRGTPTGLAAERMLDYSPMSEGLNDLPDCLSDAYSIVSGAPLCPDPSQPRPPKKPETDRDWALRRAAGKLYKKRVVI